MSGNPHSEELQPGNGKDHSHLVPSMAVPGRVDEYRGIHRSNDLVFDGHSESTEQFRGWLDVILRRLWIVLAVWIVVLAASVLWSLRLTPIFECAAVIQIVQPMTNATSGTFLQYAHPWSVLSTQMAVLGSSPFIEEFVDKSGIASTPEALTSRREVKPPLAQRLVSFVGKFAGTHSAPAPPPLTEASIKQELAGNLASNLSISRMGDGTRWGSNMVRVALNTEDPATGQKLLTAFLNYYMDRNLNSIRNDMANQASGLREQLAKAEKKLQRSESDLIEFINANEIVSKDSVGLAQLMDFFNKSMDRIKESRAEQKRIKALSSHGITADGGAAVKNDHSEYAAKIKQEIAMLESQYSEMKTRYSPDYFKMVQLNNRISALRTELTQEREKAASTALATAKTEEVLLKEALDETKKEAARANSLETQYAILKKRVETDKQSYDSVLKALNDAEIRWGVATNNVSIVEPPSLAGQPIGPRRSQYIVFGLIVGLLAGVMTAKIVDSLGQKVYDTREISSDLRVRCLGCVPDFRRLEDSDSQVVPAGAYEFLPHDRPLSPASLAIKNVETSIFLCQAIEPFGTVLISSATPSEGKTFMSVALATAMSCRGKTRTLIIDADLRRPRVHTLFGCKEPPPGLSTLLTKKNVGIEDVIRNDRIPGLHYLSAGPVPFDPSPLLNSERFTQLMKLLAAHFDRIVVDGPPILGLPDYAPLCINSDAVVLVAKQGHVRRDELREAGEVILSIHGARILGVVLNQAHPRGGAYGYGSYRSYKYYKYYSNTA